MDRSGKNCLQKLPMGTWPVMSHVPNVAGGRTKWKEKNLSLVSKEDQYFTLPPHSHRTPIRIPNSYRNVDKNLIKMEK